jgi:hypothetical protein
VPLPVLGPHLVFAAYTFKDLGLAARLVGNARSIRGRPRSR